MDLSELEAFLALSRELHFGRAAERLHLSHSRVSQLIRSLERDLGGPLFTRTSRKVEPTPLGARAQDILGPAYEALLAAYAETRAIAQGVSGALCVGFLGGLNGPEFTDLVTAFAERHPACEVTTLEVPITDFYGALRRGDADVVLTLLPVAEPDLTAGQPLAEYERTAAVPLGHPLAGHPAIGSAAPPGSPTGSASWNSPGNSASRPTWSSPPPGSGPAPTRPACPPATWPRSPT